MRYQSAFLGMLAMATAAVALPGVSRADIFGDTYAITYNGCSSGCGSLSSYGTVSVSGSGTNTLTFDVDLGSGVYFHDSNAGTTFQFSIAGAPVTAANVSGLTTGQGWTFVTPTNGLDALGTFQYGFNCAGNGGSNTCGTELDFTLTFSGATQATVVPETGGQHGTLSFGLNLAVCGTVVNCPTASPAGTGPFGATITGTPTQVPGPILGAGLPGLIAACAGLVGLARRRRRSLA